MKPAELLDRLERVRRSGGGWSALCPAHEDRTPSLSIAEGKDGRLLVKCMAGCSTPDVLAAVGLTMADLFTGGGKPRRFEGFVDAAKRCKPRPPVPPDLLLLPNVRHWHHAAMIHRLLPTLAETLGVSVSALVALRAGRASAGELVDRGNAPRAAWTLPMRDHDGTVIGCRLRYDDGNKRAVVGGRQGLFYPPDVTPRDGVLFVAEGPSDTAALLTLGVPAVGLPSAGQGGDLLSLLCERLLPDRLLLIADADEPGRRGMHAVAAQLSAWGTSCRVCVPPSDAPDVRAYLNAGGDAADILALLNAEGVRA